MRPDRLLRLTMLSCTLLVMVVLAILQRPQAGSPDAHAGTAVHAPVSHSGRG